jgi:hypothetical protein
MSCPFLRFNKLWRGAFHTVTLATHQHLDINPIPVFPAFGFTPCDSERCATFLAERSNDFGSPHSTSLPEQAELVWFGWRLRHVVLSPFDPAFDDGQIFVCHFDADGLEAFMDARHECCS